MDISIISEALSDAMALFSNILLTTCATAVVALASIITITTICDFFALPDEPSDEVNWWVVGLASFAQLYMLWSFAINEECMYAIAVWTSFLRVMAVMAGVGTGIMLSGSFALYMCTSIDQVSPSIAPFEVFTTHLR